MTLFPLKKPHEIKKMRKAGSTLRSVFDQIEPLVKAGTETRHIEDRVYSLIKKNNARPAFLNYGQGKHKFPACTCISINEQLVHGIPSGRKIEEGDIVKIDIGIKKFGYFADMARTIVVPPISGREEELVNTAKNALTQLVEVLPELDSIADIGLFIQQFVEKRNFSVIRDYTGHGIGKALHESPPVPNYYVPDLQQVKIQPGTVIAIEPMISLGDYVTQQLDDHWTVVMADNSKCSHWEHTIAIEENSCEILTA